VKGAGLPDLKAALASATWPAVVVVCGDDDEAKERALRMILAAVPEEDRATGIERFECGDDDAAALGRALDAARTAPLLGGRRVVIVAGGGYLGAGGDEDAQRLLERYVEHAPEHALLALATQKMDGRLGIAKKIGQKGLILECTQPKERDMPRWLGERASERGLRLSPRAVQLLADACGADTSLAARELDKLALLADGAGRGKTEVDESLVELALGPTRVAGAFALEDALLNGQAAAALEALDRHLAGADAGAPLALLGRMAAIVRRLALAAGAVGRGGGENDVQSALGCHPFIAQKYERAARRIGPRADRALAACVVADGMLKSGRDPRAALTRVVLSLAATARR